MATNPATARMYREDGEFHPVVGWLVEYVGYPLFISTMSLIAVIVVPCILAREKLELVMPSLGERIIGALSKEVPVTNAEGKIENPLALLRREYPDLDQIVAGRRVLDFGCGLGDQTEALASLGASVVGLDTHAPSLERARILHPGLTFVANLSELGEPCDVVISQNAMEHFPDPAATLKDMISAVKPGGRLLITFGPPWYAPYGSHMQFFCRVPWLNVLFPESAVMRARSRYRSDGASRYEDVEQGLNRMSLAKFERLIAGYNVERRHYSGVKRMDFLTAIPVIRELFTNHVTVIIRKDGEQTTAVNQQVNYEV